MAADATRRTAMADITIVLDMLTDINAKVNFLEMRSDVMWFVVRGGDWLG
jgi:hypothetical protein